MKKIFLFLLSLMLLWNPVLSYAGPKEEYEEAYLLYIAAGASTAAYSGRVGKLATQYLEQDGWQIDHYVQPQGHTGIRFLVAKKDLETNVPLYVLAIVGTESNGDIKANLKFDKVYFAGSSDEEFSANAAKQNVPNSEPKVHRGFYEFVQAGPSATLRNAHQTPFSLPDLLLTDSRSKIYLTGHSLGGAAATLTGARLISMGIRPEQIRVITFGAPAVGNAAFAAKFEPLLPLTRVVNSGDPVTGILQTLVGGYKQFGQEIKWITPATVNDPHLLIGYLDSAIKNYYDKRQQAIAAGIQLPAPTAVAKRANHGRVYIAPLQNNLPASLTADFWYMNEALYDEYRQTIPDYTLSKESTSTPWREAATTSGCQWAILSEVNAMRVKQERNTYYITISQTVYNVATGSVADTTIFSTGTYNLTPLEAFIHASKGMNSLQHTWLRDTTIHESSKNQVYANQL
ncbi:lipase family protein [Pelosinus fermentans]|uniref:Lipase class 3 n=1 Tax=Pelosinus fermentans JBW45 TaxID=1192197 RepID=I8U5N2_9FIRM|nr:lipase family protein [Pelosinus fermentans]AJQ27028.1 lipase class 3 [Pelosinus fermentans JBW45]